MDIRSLVLALAVATAGPAMASTCTRTFNRGVMGPSATTQVGDSFNSVQHFSDCYDFTLSTASNSSGLLGVFDLSWARDIDLTSIALSGGNLAGALVDTTPAAFSFSNLAAGTYELMISGDVTGFNGGAGLVSYKGLFSTAAATPVPEPGTYSLMAMGLAVVAWVARRRLPS